MGAIIQVKNKFIPWDYTIVQNYQPDSGEIVCVKNTPLYGVNNVLLVGDDALHTIAWLAANQIPSAATIQAALTAEIAARQTGDAALQGQINTANAEITDVRQIALGASVALVFDDKAALDAWMAANPPVAHNGYYPADLRSGWKALIREEDEPDYWWDGDAGAWRENEAKIDLSAYRTAAAQDAIDALFAPLHSPAFTGTPTTPDPSFTVPAQVANIQALIWMRDLILMTILNKARVTRTPNAFMGSRIRVTRAGRMRGVYWP
jgi:hypothetical protein